MTDGPECSSHGLTDGKNISKGIFSMIFYLSKYVGTKSKIWLYFFRSCSTKTKPTRQWMTMRIQEWRDIHRPKANDENTTISASIDLYHLRKGHRQ